jgi:hypothetical protein
MAQLKYFYSVPDTCKKETKHCKNIYTHQSHKMQRRDVICSKNLEDMSTDFSICVIHNAQNYKPQINLIKITAHYFANVPYCVQMPAPDMARGNIKPEHMFFASKYKRN